MRRQDPVSCSELGAEMAIPRQMPDSLRCHPELADATNYRPETSAGTATRLLDSTPDHQPHRAGSPNPGLRLEQQPPVQHPRGGIGDGVQTDRNLAVADLPQCDWLELALISQV